MMLVRPTAAVRASASPDREEAAESFPTGHQRPDFRNGRCNLGCKFCQNWDISKSRETERLSQRALPDEIARAALEMGCASVAYTYNDPVIWAEYAIDTPREPARNSASSRSRSRPWYINAGGSRRVLSIHGRGERRSESVSPKSSTTARRCRTCSRCSTRCVGSGTRPTSWFEITNLVIPRPTMASTKSSR